MNAIQSTVKRVTLNSLWLLIGRAASHGLMLVFTVLVARSLGEAGLGRYAFIASVVFLGNVVTTFGMDTLLIREIATTRRTDTSVLPAAFVIEIVLSVAFIAVVFVAAGRLPNLNPETAGALTLYSFALVPLAVATVFSAVLRAYERMDLYLLFNLTTAVAQTAGAFFVFRAGGGLHALVWLLLVVEVIGAVVAGALCMRNLPESDLLRAAHRVTVRRIIGGLQPAMRAGGVLAALAILAVVYQRMGIFTLSLMTTDAMTGWYSAAARVTEAFKMLPYAVFGALFPVMSRRAFSDGEQTEPTATRVAAVEVFGDNYCVDTREKMVNGKTRHVASLHQHLIKSTVLDYYDLVVATLFGFALLASIGTTFFADFGINLLFGSGYAPAARALQILIWSLLPFVLTLKLSFELVAAGQEIKALYAMVATMGTAILLYLVLVPAYGLTGACWATVAAETAQAGILAATHRMGAQSLTVIAPEGQI